MAVRLLDDESLQLDPDLFIHHRPISSFIRISMGYARSYADRVNLAAMTPQPALASSGFCLASTSAKQAELLVYLPVGPWVTVDLTGVEGKLMVEWFNPATAEVSKGPPVAGGGRVFFASLQGWLTALDASTGKLLWRTALDGEAAALARLQAVLDQTLPIFEKRPPD
jgi:hypothetical protein